MSAAAPPQARPQLDGLDRSGCSATRHGTYSAYRHQGCTCADAQAAFRRYARYQRSGRPELCPDTTTHVDARPLRRRIRALYAIGHTEADLAARLGYTNRRGDIPLMHSTRTTVFATTADKIRAVYEQLREVTGPSEHNVRRAVMFGWRTPAQWDVLGTLDDPDADDSDAALRRAEAAARRRLPAPVRNPDDAWAQAVCRAPGADPERWFATLPAQIAEAVADCHACPIRRDCLRFALLSNERYGVWGGVDADERAHLHSELAAAVGTGAALLGTGELDAVLDAYAPRPTGGLDEAARNGVVPA